MGGVKGPGGGGSAWRKNGTTITWQLRTVAFTHTHSTYGVFYLYWGSFLEREVQLQVSRQTGRQAGDNRAFHMPFYAICSLVGIYHSDTTQSTNMPLGWKWVEKRLGHMRNMKKLFIMMTSLINALASP